MIRQSPCHFYIKYLCSRPDNLSTHQIIELLKEKDLDWLSGVYIDKIREQLQIPEPFYPSDFSHGLSRAFLLKEKLLSIYQPDNATRQALKILEKPRAKEFVEALSLAGAPAKVISGFLGERHKLQMSEEGVLKYQHYFWNLEMVDSADVRALLEIRSQGYYDHPFTEVANKADALKNIKYNDPRFAAANLPSSPVTAVVAQMRIGIMPTGVEIAKLLEATKTAASIRAMECALNGGPSDSKKALDYITTAKIAHEMLGEMVKPEDELKKQLQSIELRTTEARVPQIHELSGGNHTVDLMVSPEEELDETE